MHAGFMRCYAALHLHIGPEVKQLNELQDTGFHLRCVTDCTSCGAYSIVLDTVLICCCLGDQHHGRRAERTDGKTEGMI
jgi:hypothetical protein